MVAKYHLNNLDCANCALKIEDHLKSKPDIRFASVNYAALTLVVESDSAEPIRGYVSEIEPDVELVSLSHGLQADVAQDFNTPREIKTLAISSILFVVGLIFENLLHQYNLPYIEYPLAISAYLIAGSTVLRNAWRTIRRGDLFDENVLMAIAALGAIAIHALFEAVGVMIFFKTGELLQNLAVNKSRKSIRSLLAIRPNQAHVVKSESEVVDKSPDEIAAGDVVIVRPGEKIPLDGEVIKGETRLDTSPLTGEPVPKSAVIGDQVYAGEINLSSLLTIRVTRPFEQSSISRVLNMVENALTRKAKTEKFITRIARYYTPAVVIIAASVALLPPLLIPGEAFQTWIYRALVLLVISCPCALVISIPLGFFGGIGGASRNGILVKGASHLETLAGVNTVVFDKTGTLTHGVFKVVDLVPADGFTKEQLLLYAATAEYYSNHPIAQSIRQSFAAYGIDIDALAVSDHTEIPGKGVRVQAENHQILAGNESLLADFGHVIEKGDYGLTVVHVGIDNKYVGRILIGDEIKPGALELVKHLKKWGVKKTFMLTGDNETSARKISETIGLDGYYAGLLPEDKVRLFEELMKHKHQGKIAFVGDGINDAPVLARADIGIAMGTLGSDAAIETADVVITGDSPNKVADAIAIGKATKAIVWQNIILALLVKIVFIVAGSFGLAGMWEAVFADMGTALLAIFNSTRALRIRA